REQQDGQEKAGVHVKPAAVRSRHRGERRAHTAPLVRYTTPGPTTEHQQRGQEVLKVRRHEDTVVRRRAAPGRT
ncbi:hypothetical protein CTI14_46545, partial [Methylobacterium radiotolerans]